MATPVLELIGVRKSFTMPGGEQVSIPDIDSFQLAADEHCALEGRSGSGKSTLLNVISGIMRPDAGRVIIDGKDIARLDEARRDRVRADKLGLVFQQFNLLPGFTALENVLVAMSFGSGRPDRARATRLLDAVGLGHRLDHKPAELSVGQQQRVAAARALIGRPPLVIADEPTSALDEPLRDAFMSLLMAECREGGSTLVFVSHDARLAQHFDERLSLRDMQAGQALPETVA